MDNTCFYTCEIKNVEKHIKDLITNSAEIENIENMILGGRQPAEILQLFPHYHIEHITKLVENIAHYCWFSESTESKKGGKN